MESRMGFPALNRSNSRRRAEVATLNFKGERTRCIYVYVRMRRPAIALEIGLFYGRCNARRDAREKSKDPLSKINTAPGTFAQREETMRVHK